MKNLEYKEFGKVDLSDSFFDSLKDDYKEFEAWFLKKQRTKSSAYVFYNSKKNVTGFLYMKVEDEIDDSITPPIPTGKTIKLGTLKIEARGTRLGERFIKKVFDYALSEGAEYVYVTIFEKHTKLVSLLSRYGFESHGEKKTRNGTELVLVKEMGKISGNVARDFPNLTLENANYYLLAIYPEYHSSFLPDSILKNESHDILEDVSYTNSIHKAYISGLPKVKKLKQGDVLVIYRTKDKKEKGRAFYRAVATSIGVVEEVRQIKSFSKLQDFIDYAKPYSIFTLEKLKDYFTNQQKRYIIRFTYNAALRRRITRGKLITECGISTTGKWARWDFVSLTKGQVEWIIEAGNVSENTIIY